MIKEIKSLWARRHWLKSLPRCSIIVQGPLHPNAVYSLNEYRKWSEPVYISHWDDDLEGDLPPLKGVRYVTNTYEDIGHNGNNISRQVQTTRNALEVIETPYFIKIRSDIRVSNLSPFIEAVVNNPTKLVTTNIFWRLDRFLHPSDYIVGGLTESMRSCLDQLKQTLYNNRGGVTGEMIGIRGAIQGLSPEQMMACHWALCKGERLDLSRNLDILRKHFYCVPIGRLGEYEVTSNALKKTYKTGEVIPDSLETMEAL
jgi:hypothetical protein